MPPVQFSLAQEEHKNGKTSYPSEDYECIVLTSAVLGITQSFAHTSRHDGGAVNDVIDNEHIDCFPDSLEQRQDTFLKQAHIKVVEIPLVEGKLVDALHKWILAFCDGLIPLE